jgi:methionine sulfoxide reductase heme-binding subunit
MSELAAKASHPATALHRPQKLAWLGPAVFTGGLVPLTFIAFRLIEGSMIEPVAEILNQFGLLALIFLISSLSCTPLKVITGWTWPLRLRRMLGVYAFFYAFMHFITYAVFDKDLKLSDIVDDVLKRPFIYVGLAALLILTPLAITSTTGMIRRLGAKNWQRLHKLAYVAGILGIIHFWMRVKIDITEPVVYGSILTALLLVRIINWLKPKPARP